MFGERSHGWALVRVNPKIFPRKNVIAPRQPIRYLEVLTCGACQSVAAPQTRYDDTTVVSGATTYLPLQPSRLQAHSSKLEARR